MNQKSDFEKLCEEIGLILVDYGLEGYELEKTKIHNEFQKHLEENKRKILKSELIKIDDLKRAGFNILSDRELEKILKKYGRKLLIQNDVPEWNDVDIKQFLKEWKEKRRRE